MSLPSRLERIERKAAKLRAGNNCSSCGRICGAGARYLLGTAGLEACSDCGLPVNAHGQAVGFANADGTVDGIKRYAWGDDPLGLGEGER